jgi:uncharacterized membrane protein
MFWEGRMEPTTTHLPAVNTIGLTAPFGWLAGGWADFRKALWPCLVYGAILVVISVSLAVALYFAGALRWLFALAAGFMLVAPMFAMGLYKTGRMLEQGERPRIGDILFVRSAFRQDLMYLGLALFLVYSFWVEASQIIYGLSTYRVHKTLPELLTFMFTEPDGQNMVVVGTAVGGVIAFLAFSLVVVSAPMLLNEKTNVFIATITSVRTITQNFLPMLVWAMLIVALTALGIATGFLGLIVTFPVIGLASWRAYRELVPSSHGDMDEVV